MIRKKRKNFYQSLLYPPSPPLKPPPTHTMNRPFSVTCLGGKKERERGGEALTSRPDEIPNKLMSIRAIQRLLTASAGTESGGTTQQANDLEARARRGSVGRGGGGRGRHQNQHIQHTYTIHMHTVLNTYTDASGS